MKNRRIHLLLILASLFSLWYCANPGTPTGGPKDEKPPVLVNSTPKQNALNFNGKTIELEFDELIQLKDANQKFVVSPPVNKRPIIDPRGKNIRITFEEELQPATTYTLDFADAISDNNESNILDNFRFSFSTGESTDSMAVSGNLFDAYDLSPADGILMFLHRNLEDSAFVKLVPNRIAKTDAKGRFSIQNVAPGEYRLYALDDLNRNYKFDQRGEQIAFVKEVVVPSFEYRMVNDSITPDSIVAREQLFYTPDSIQMHLFKEKPVDQYLKSEERKQANKLSFMFNLPLSRNARFAFPGRPQNDQPFVMERSLQNDTVTLWLTDSLMYKQDSLKIAVNYPALDSLLNPIERIDTLDMWHFTVEQKKRRKKDEKEEIPALKINVPSTIDLYAPLNIILPTPAKYADQAGLKLFLKSDTLQNNLTFNFEQDTLNVRRYKLQYNWQPGEEYVLAMDSATFIDFYGVANKPINQNFSIRKLDSYGTLYINVANPQPNYLIQIINRDEKVLRQSYVPTSGKIAFRYIKVGEYMLKMVDDTNRNGVWDTGDYANHTLPETVFYYPEKVNVRANWDIKIEMDRALFNIYEFSQKFRKPISTRKKQ
ncbi:MAG: Ig-like domain-containing protein [Breznakibacter sp.]|nr:Ig-like domain-containing protein [Breznakibacter sp.]